MGTHETLRGRLLLAIREHGITAEEIVRHVGGDALPQIGDAVRGRLSERIDEARQTYTDLTAGVERCR